MRVFGLSRIGPQSSATWKSAPVHALIDSTLSPSATSVRTRPLPCGSTSNTAFSVMIFDTTRQPDRKEGRGLSRASQTNKRSDQIRSAIRSAIKLTSERKGATRENLWVALLIAMLHRHDNLRARRHQIHRTAHTLDKLAGYQIV